jgi:hypothetical protein
MKKTIIGFAISLALTLVTANLSAQEMIATPDPVGGAKPEADAKPSVAVPPSPTPGTSGDPAANNWRYRWFNGHWWYWTPEKKWMTYNDQRRWVASEMKPGGPAVAERKTPAVVESRVPMPIERNVYMPPPVGSYYPGAAYYYPDPYWAGYYPGVAVGVWPYGNVYAGRRVGVDIWGPHGSVRVGRMRVGW